MGNESVMQEILEQNAQNREKLRKHPQLAFLFFEVTTRCNLRCLHCGSSCTKHGSDRAPHSFLHPAHAEIPDQGERSPHCAENTDQGKRTPRPIGNTDMPVGYITAVLDSVERNYAPHDPFPLLCITGGEPLLYPNLIEAMTLASQRGFAWGMTTNATLIRDETARSLYDAGLVTTTVSVDGLEDSHDWFRNTPGAYKRMKRGLAALINHAPDNARVDVITVVNKRNISELPELYRRLQDSGIRSWRITNMEPIGRALEHPDLMLDRNDFVRLLDFVTEAHLSSPAMEVSYGCSHYLTPKYERRARSYCFTCMAGLQAASIAANGDIIACLDIERRPDLVQGNVERDDFWHVWQNGFGVFRSDRAEKSTVCSTCPDKRFCAGDSAHTWNYDRNEPTICIKNMLEKSEELDHGFD